MDVQTTAQWKVEKLLERILAITYEVSEGRRWSHVALFKEYLRRMALWANAVGQTEEDWLFFDVAESINPEIPVDETALIELDLYLRDKPWLGIMQDVFRWALHWAAFEDTPEAVRFGLPDPYEPLVVLYERGGFFRESEQGYWEISKSFGVSGVDMNKYDRSKPFVELDPELLDMLDSPEDAL